MATGSAIIQNERGENSTKLWLPGRKWVISLLIMVRFLLLLIEQTIFQPLLVIKILNDVACDWL